MKRIVLLIFAVMLVCLSFSSSGVKVYAKDNNIDITAKSYVVIDTTGNKLMESKSDEKREVASICKLMTSLLTLEKIEAGELSLQDKFIVSEYAAGVEGSQAFLDAGSEYSVEELLKSVIIASANDSAIALAEGVCGSERAFVEQMNNRASKLGMLSTLYANSTGLPAPEQYSTAYDTALLLKYLSKFELYHKYCSIWLDSLTHPSGRVTELVNTNRNIRYYEYCEMGKTGFTDEAGYCLATLNTKGNFSIITVVLGSSNSANRFTDSMKLSNYVFANFTTKKVVDSATEVDNSVRVDRGKRDTVTLYPSEDIYLTSKIGGNDGYDIRYILPPSVEAEVRVGDEIGEVLVIRDGVVITSVPIVSGENIERQSYGDIVGKILDNFSFIN